MHDHPKGADEDCAISTAEDDNCQQSAVLRQVLEHHPAGLTLDELIRELNGGGTREFEEIDRVNRAVRDLAGTGLVHRPGEDEIVRPTRAAVRFSELTEGAF